jgi:2-succinyl-6-hydroxy-2,4-cyclohexadiene-1-carboxylate synthase
MRAVVETGERVSTFEVIDVGPARVGVRRWRRRHVPAGGREALVLLHGFTGSSESWSPIAERLSATGDVVAIDLPGHGASTPDTRDGACAFERTASLLDGTIETLGLGRVALAGYSLGGRVALYATLARPQRVARLILESTSPGIATESERAERRASDDRLAELVLGQGIEAFVDRWQRTPVLASQLRLPASTRAALREARLRCSPEGIAASLRTLGAGQQPYLADRLVEIGCPVLIIAGRDDEKYAVITDALRRAITGSRLAIVANAGHDVHLEQPDAFVALLNEFTSEGARASVPLVRGHEHDS